MFVHMISMAPTSLKSEIKYRNIAAFSNVWRLAKEPTTCSRRINSHGSNVNAAITADDTVPWIGGKYWAQAVTKVFLVS